MGRRNLVNDALKPWLRVGQDHRKDTQQGCDPRFRCDKKYKFLATPLLSHFKLLKIFPFVASKLDS